MLESDPEGTGPVLLHFKNSWQFVCAYYGVLFAGRTYVPVDTEFPELRLLEIVKISGARIGISLAPSTLSLEVQKAVRLSTFEKASRYQRERMHDLPVRIPEGKPAVILFTSGSTGRPKGVLLSEKMLFHQCWRRIRSCDLTPGDRYAVLYTSAFMGAVNAMHPPILAGSTLCFYDLRKRGFGELPDWLKEERITVLHTITSILRRFLTVWKGSPPLNDLRMLIPGGERSREDDLDLWRKACAEKVKYCTCLGSTECGTLAMNPLAMNYSHQPGPLPVGKPYASMGVKVLREDGSLADRGEEGQIVVESKYIFDGYLAEKELTNAVLSHSPNGLARYLTGDFGYIDTQGVLFNAGRRDSRVKVSGNLVELAEIEAQIMLSGLVEEVAVLFRKVDPDDKEKRLVCFYRTTNRDLQDLHQELTEYLLKRVPKAMIPSNWMRLTLFPETVNGKTDRKAMMTIPL